MKTRRKKLLEVEKTATTHPGLWLDKYIEEQEKKDVENRSYKTLLANASNTGMVQCKEKVVKESTGKEESHVDVCTRVGNHSRGDGAFGPCGLSERHLGDSAARCTGRTVSGRA